MKKYSHPFNPFIDKDSKILILGTFPSIKSFEENFYYSHPKNQFWRLLAGVFKEDIPKDLDNKKKLLKKYNIALWDIIKECRRKNSLDSNLTDIKVNNIEKLLKKYPNIKKIFFTSKTALKHYEKNFKNLDINYDYLPSPSPAYAKLKFEEKLNIWIKKFDMITLDEFLNIIDIIDRNLPNNSFANRLKNSYNRNPYTILMVTLLSLRSKDEKTAIVAKKLFKDINIQTPKELLKLSQEELEDIIRPIGFYRQKAKTLIEVSNILISKYSSIVPNSKEELLSIKGIGEKTANIVLNNAFGISSIAVDTHVHRLVNFFDFLKTKDEKETSKILNNIIPNNYKNKINYLLVSFGQMVCKVNNPECKICQVKCKKGKYD